ncbi:MAG TPA: hypothetical protein VF533_07160, partial [Solirubrobacteraceae bacterium]|jgi:hypothetical protein
VLYVLRARAGRYERVAAARLRGRDGRFTAALRAPRVRLRGRDVLVPCVAGLAREGIGAGDALERGCGRRTVPAPPVSPRG